MELGHRIISDGMVLQRGKQLVFTGDLGEAAQVAVSLAEVTVRAEVRDSRFRAVLPALPAGGPYSLTFDFGTRKRVIRDVLIGDVYYMSGQSNMELTIGWVYHSFEDEIDGFDCALIRQFKVPIDYDFDKVLPDVRGGRWACAAGPDKADFGAIGFFMAKKLYAEQGVPIGLIQTAVPGCPIESFLKREEAELFGPAEVPEICHDPEAMKRQLALEQEQWDARIADLLEADARLTDAPWRRVVIPFLEEDPEKRAGIRTFKKSVFLENAPAGEAVLELGLIIEADFTYVNGVKVGESAYQYLRRRYTVPAGVLHEGENEIEVRVVVTGGVCRFWEKLPYELRYDDVCIDLSGVWEYQRGAEAEALTRSWPYEYEAYGVYNAMAAPLMEYEVCGLLWYQGESNTGAPMRYAEKFETLVRQLRRGFRDEKLPMYYVQLAYYEDPNDPDGSGWAAIRAEQEKSQSLPGAYMIVSGDVGSPTDLHPQNKKAIGERIAEKVLERG